MTVIASQPSDHVVPEPSVLLEMRRVAYEGDPDNGIRPVGPTDLSIHRGEAVALVGPERSTIVRLMAGELKASRGTITRLADGGSRHVRMMSRGTLEVGGRCSINDLSAEMFPDTIDRNVTERRVRSALHRVGFDLPDDADTLVIRSPADVQRHALATAMMEHPNVIVADEPFAALRRRDVAPLLQALVGYCGRRTAVVVATNRFDIAEMCSTVVDLGDTSGSFTS